MILDKRNQERMSLRGDPTVSGSFADAVLDRQLTAPTMGLSFDEEVPAGFIASRTMETAGVPQPVRSERDMKAVGLGAMVTRRPTLSEIEMGAKIDDMVLMPSSARISPFKTAKPETRTIMGHENPQLQIRASKFEPSDLGALYGDVADIVNQIASGAATLTKKVASSDQWGKLSPGVKAALGIGAGLLGAKAVSSVVPNLMMYRLGKSVADAKEGSDAGEVMLLAPETSPVTQSLVNGSVGVSRVGESLMMGRRWMPIPVDFFSGAYALGKEYSSRRSRPTFGLLSSDPTSVAKSLRGLRCPKLWVNKGRILRTSAPYVEALPLHTMRVVLSPRIEMEPLAGGIWGEVIGAAGGVIKDAAKSILGKVGEWAKSLLGKLGTWLKHVFSPHTNGEAKNYSMKVTPPAIAARLWNMLGLIKNTDIDDLESDIFKDVEAIMAIRDQRKRNAEEEKRSAAMLKRLETLRTSKGVPSNVPWSYDVVHPDKIDLSPVLDQYAPRTAKHVKELSTCSSNDLVDIFGTRNPALLFSDPDSLEADLQEALDAINGSGAATAGNTASTQVAGSTMPMTAMIQQAKGGAQTGVGTPTSGVGAAALASGGATIGPNGSVLITDPNNVSDPDVLAALLAATAGGTVASVPNAWIAQLPPQIQRNYYGQMTTVEDPGAVVGDPLSPRRCQAGYRYHICSPMSTVGEYQGEPLKGFIPAVVAAGKFFLTWVLPFLIAAIPWDKVGSWFTKNFSKASAIRSASNGGKATMAASAAKSGGFLGAFAGAMKTLARGSGKVARVILSLVSKHPKGAIAAALLSACFVVGSSYSKRSNNSFSELISLLLRCVDELVALGVLTSQQGAQHKAALEAIGNSGSDITEIESQELQTVAVLCAQTYLALSDGSEASAANMTALAEFYECCQRSASDAQAALAGNDKASLESVCMAVIDEAANSADAGNAGEPSSPVDPDVMAAIGAAGGSVVGVASAGKADGRASRVDGDSLAEEAASLSRNQGSTDSLSTDYADVGQASDSSGDAISSALDGLNESQLMELSSITDAAMTLEPQAILDEEASGVGQVGKAISDAVVKWGLPVAAASAITKLVLDAVKARKGFQARPKAGRSLIDGASRWWSGVAAKLDDTAPLPTGETRLMEVAL